MYYWKRFSPFKGYGENTASAIDEEVREIVDTCYKKG